MQRERRLFTEGHRKMRLKAVSGIMLTLLLVGMLTLAFKIQVLEANPIPVPSLWMPEEYIDAKISLADGVVQAGVNGTYPFIYFFPFPPYPLTFDEVIMYYPIPPDADKTTVEMDETKLDWIYSNKTYPTVLGDWPMINWTVKPVPEYFEIETYYEHLLPMIGGNYTFLYAMGTGRYLDHYAKETTAYVSVSISKDVAPSERYINVYTTTEEGTWKPANYTMIREEEAWIVTLTVVSEKFHPLEEDLLITIKAKPTTWTVDDDGPADFHTIQEAVNAASDGDTILVRAGTYNEEVLIKGKSISLIGEDPSTTLIDRMLGGIPIEVRIAERVNITGFTVMNSGAQWRSNMFFENWPESGILLWNSDECNVHGNIVKYNYYGVTIYSSWPESKYNTLSDNLIANNSAAGIFLEGHVETGLVYSETTIIENTITNNWGGLSSYLHSDNRICHNSFINNTLQTLLTTGDTHIWDDGYPSGGNYWNDYTAVDANMDGIGDSFYEIDSNNIDHYPLMGMFSDFNATSEYHIQTICNSSISDFQFNGTAIYFNVTGKEHTTGFCRICIPRALMNETYKVFVNGTEAPCNLLPCSNTIHSYLYFTYNLSTQEVIVIPEFPSFIILPLFMIATLLAVILYRRKHST